MDEAVENRKHSTISHFLNKKKQALQGVDCSRKGSIDVDIRNLVEEINSREEYFTTSSCSGRVILFTENPSKKKHLCKWLYTSHSDVNEAEFFEKIDPSEGELTLKFEPMILHIQCFSLESSKRLLTCALEAGFRNSGIMIGKHDKITLAVRSCLGLEVPISYNGNILVSKEYLQFLVNKCNNKLEENRHRIEKFFEILQHTYSR